MRRLQKNDEVRCPEEDEDYFLGKASGAASTVRKKRREYFAHSHCDCLVHTNPQSDAQYKAICIDDFALGSLVGY